MRRFGSLVAQQEESAAGDNVLLTHILKLDETEDQEGGKGGLQSTAIDLAELYGLKVGTLPGVRNLSTDSRQIELKADTHREASDWMAELRAVCPIEAMPATHTAVSQSAVASSQAVTIARGLVMMQLDAGTYCMDVLGTYPYVHGCACALVLQQVMQLKAGTITHTHHTNRMRITLHG